MPQETVCLRKPPSTIGTAESPDGFLVLIEEELGSLRGNMLQMSRTHGWCQCREVYLDHDGSAWICSTLCFDLSPSQLLMRLILQFLHLSRYIRDTRRMFEETDHRPTGAIKGVSECFKCVEKPCGLSTHRVNAEPLMMVEKDWPTNLCGTLSLSQCPVRASVSEGLTDG